MLVQADEPSGLLGVGGKHSCPERIPNGPAMHRRRRPADPEHSSLTAGMTGNVNLRVLSAPGRSMVAGWTCEWTACAKRAPMVEGQRQGRWLSYGFDESNSRPSLIEIYRDGSESTTGIPNWSNPAGDTPEERKNTISELKELLIAGAAPIPTTPRNPPPRESCKRPRVMPVTSI